MTNAPDIERLVERLRTMTDPAGKGYPCQPRNPDGEEAATLITEQAARIEALEGALRRGLTYIEKYKLMTSAARSDLRAVLHPSSTDAGEEG